MKIARSFLKASIVFLALIQGNAYSQFYDLVLEDMSINEYTAPFVAENSITASNFTVLGNGNVTFKAGNTITLLPGFSVREGALFHAYIDEGEILGKNNPVTFDGDIGNFPNPFNGKTTIRFSSQSTGRTSIKVLNTIGQEVETLFDMETKSNTEYQVVFDGQGMPPGIYFYKLAAPGFTIVKKMVLANP